MGLVGLIGTLVAFLLFGDRLQPLQVFGAAVIVAGIITVQAVRHDADLTLPAVQ